MDAPPNVVDADTATPDGRPASPGPPTEEEPDRVLLGVAGHIAGHLGLDALWVRLGFVVLALTGGIGIVIYLASWLVLFGPDRTGMVWVRYAGGAIALIGVPIMIANGNLEFFNGPVVVVALLIGLTLALWQPRTGPAPRSPVRAPLPPPLGRGSATTTLPNVATDELEPVGGFSPDDPRPAMTAAREPVRHRRSRQEPSILGRTTLGLAVIVAAVGALIDQVTGGRLHPEQWLGAAALVCGIGLLVGVLRGRAWWLIVPALLFAGTGYLAGLMTRLGIDAVDAVGNQSLYVSESTPGGSATLQSALGSVWITVDGAPTEPLTIDARSALGSIEVRAVDDVAIEIHSVSDRGDLIVDGVVATGDVMRIGPDRAPDVIVDARQGIGDVVVWTYFPDQQVRGRRPGLPVADPTLPPGGPEPDVGVAPVPPAFPGATATAPPVITAAPVITALPETTAPPSAIETTVPPDSSATTTLPAPSTTIGD